MNKPVTAILEREMSRKEFITTMGFGLASVLGLSNIIGLLTGKSFDHQMGLHKQGFGYGSTPYGGGKD
jgi:hypothetical protein